jgi:hypothetical protein
MAKQARMGQKKLQKDRVTKYLEMVVKGLVKTSELVSVGKTENSATRVVVYRFYVPDGAKSFFRRPVVRSGLAAMTGRAAYKFYPNKYEKDKWQVSLKKSANPI